MSVRVCTLTNHWSRYKPGYTHWHTDADTATVVVVNVISDDDVVVVVAAVVVIVAVGVGVVLDILELSIGQQYIQISWFSCIWYSQLRRIHLF